jgi:CRP-like cAMP-binding protein
MIQKCFIWINDHKHDWGFIKKHGLREEYQYGDVIVAAGQTMDRMFYIEQGYVKYVILSYNGTEKIIGILSPGAVFGEGPVFSQLPVCMSALAMDYCVLFSLKKAQLEELISQNPFLVTQIIKTLHSKFVMAVKQLEEICFHPPEKRIYNLLVTLSRQQGVAKADKVKINIRLTHQQIGEIIGVTRVTVTRGLTKLRKKGLIEIKNDYIYLTCQETRDHEERTI